MSLRTRLRRWLGVEQNDVDLQRHTFELQDHLKKDMSLQNQIDGLSTSLNSTSKGHRELIDDALKGCITLRKDLDSNAADNVAMYETAKQEYGSVTQQLTGLRREYDAYRAAFRAAFFDRMSKAEGDLGNLYGHSGTMDAAIAGQAKINEQCSEERQTLDGRLVALETASKSLGAQLAFIAENARDIERKRCAALIQRINLPFFRASHRETIVKMIWEGTLVSSTWKTDSKGTSK